MLTPLHVNGSWQQLLKSRNCFSLVSTCLHTGVFWWDLRCWSSYSYVMCIFFWFSKSVCCTQWCIYLWIVHSGLSIWFSLTFLYSIDSLVIWMRCLLCLTNYITINQYLIPHHYFVVHSHCTVSFSANSIGIFILFRKCLQGICSANAFRNCGLLKV